MGVKDSGFIIFGYGGLFDWIDVLMFIVMVMFLFIYWVMWFELIVFLFW